VSVLLEKVQVAVLAERLGRLLDELVEAGLAEPTAPPAELDLAPLDEPLVEAFRAGTLTLGWEGDEHRILVEARAIEHDDDDDESDADGDDESDEDESDEDDDPPGLAEFLSEAARGGDPNLAGLPGGPVPFAMARFRGAGLAGSGLSARDRDPHGPDILRVRLSVDEARGFAESALRVVTAGRPPCPMCGQPLDPQGHLCPRRNGSYLN
jgi:hypothetical protein